MTNTTDKQYEDEQKQYREYYEGIYRNHSTVLGAQLHEDGRPRLSNSAMSGIDMVRERLQNIKQDSEDRFGKFLPSLLNDACQKRDSAIKQWIHWEKSQDKNYEKPFGRHLEAIERYQAKICILEEEARLLNQMVREHEKKESEKKEEIKSEIPLLQKGSGRLQMVEQEEWNRREVIKDKDSAYISTDYVSKAEQYIKDIHKLEQVKRKRLSGVRERETRPNQHNTLE